MMLNYCVVEQGMLYYKKFSTFMLYSKLFGKTTKTTPTEEKIISNKLLYQAGYVRESVAGRYYFLPLGHAVQQKIMDVVREEMNAANAQEMLSPVLHPLELWKETNRTNTAGFELMKVKDRRDAEFALGGTAEEMFVDLVRKFQISYKDLPFNLYQFALKFRDEMRARGGLLRVREFLMKDAYSFHSDEEDFKKEYDKMAQTYTKIFERLGLKTIKVESDNGYIGGEYCHEYVVESEIGESRFLMTDNGSYAAHEDVAKFFKPEIKDEEEMKEREDAEGKGVIGVVPLAKFLKIPVEKTTKTILFETEKGEIVAAAVGGQYDINEAKLIHVLSCARLQLARPEIVKKITGAEVGYAGLLNLPKNVRIVMDETMKGRRNFEMGANKTNYHSININFGRDLEEPREFYDIAMAQAGYTAPDGKNKLIEKKGIEVGNIFQLGHHYAKLMKGADFTDEDGKRKPYYMGCYGIGIGRTLASIVEMHHDEKGIVWPVSVAPYRVHLVGLDLKDESVKKAAHLAYEALSKQNIEVLFDDRENTHAGEKFKDADLIGIPHRLVVSKKTGNNIEYKLRTSNDNSLLTLDEVILKINS